MNDNQKTVSLPRGWPNGDWCPPRAVIDRMTQAEVSGLIAAVRQELDFLAAWNDRRGEPKPLPDFCVPFPTPEQYNWNVKTRR